MSINIDTPFIPVCGTDEKITNAQYSPGRVYFSTDTKKIYLDANNSRLPMGGNTGIFYGDIDFGNFQGPEFEFIIGTDLEGDNEPNVNDLIINSDGCFYKVIRKLDEKIIANRIVLSGSSTGPSSSSGQVKVTVLNGYSHTIITGGSLSLQFKFSAYNEDKIGTGNGTYEIQVDGVSVKRGQAFNNYDFNGVENPDIINVVPVGDLFKLSKKYKVRIICHGYNGYGETTVTVNSPEIEINVTDFEVTWEEKETNINYIENDFKTEWNISVDGDDVITNILIDDSYLIKDISGTELNISAEDFSNMGLTHGVHKFELTSYANIGGVVKPSKTIVKNLIFYDRNDSSYIIICNFFEKEIQQYDTVRFPVMIYHHTNTDIDGATIEFFVNGETEPRGSFEKVGNLDPTKVFSFTPEEAGLTQISFKTANGSLKTLRLIVKPLNIEVDEVPGFDIKFKPSTFSNNEAIKNWRYKEEAPPITFSENFDWINGGLITNEGDHGTYFKIPAGSSIELPYYLFKTNFNLSSGGGACCKIIFKAVNCRDYDAEVLSCFSNQNNRGLKLNAQNGVIKHMDGELNVQYCEDTYIEYEFNIDNKYLTVWLDGVPAVTQLLSSPTFQQSDAQKVKIGSNDCDVHLYLFKVYLRSLTTDEHLNNFIVDTPKSSEIKSRFDRNDILSTVNGKPYIDPQKLAEKNPNCNVFVYKIPYMPTSKDDVFILENGKQNKKCCSFIQYKGSSQALRSYDEVSLRAQGTSSMAYGISAFNLDAKFPEEWSLDDNAIPVNYFNTKVNVASCEGANNAINQEWYNRFQPYKTQKRLASRQDGKISRDTMQFINGVLFIEDHNKEISSSSPESNNVFKEIDKYTSNPYPRMYSIANMGNSKKNTQVFHGEGNQFECCVEVADNNTNGQQMVTIGGYVPKDPDLGTDEHEVPIIFPEKEGLFDENGLINYDMDWGESYDEINKKTYDNKFLWENALIQEGLFEFRYWIDDEEDYNASKLPEFFSSQKEYQNELSRRFLRLVRWFAKWNPANTYSEYDIEHNLSKLLYEKEKNIKFNSIKYQNDLKKYIINDIEDNYSQVISPEEILSLKNIVQQNIKEEYPKLDIESENFQQKFLERYYEKLIEKAKFEDIDVDNIISKYTNIILNEINTAIINEWKEILANKTELLSIINMTDEEVKNYYGDYMYQTVYLLPNDGVEFSSDDLKVVRISTIYPGYTGDVLAGKFQSSLAKKHKLDSKEYRAANMLKESKDYLIMDSIVYHYLFIERHTMVDNVAKNTFWNTEDGIHWELTKNYDNDTSDGVNNSGYLAFNYGAEIMDNDASGSPIFNARASSWLNFIQELPELREIMYKNQISAWESKPYLEEFEKWQNAIPERCWIEDFYRKYFRPNEIYNNNTYLPRLANGKKTHQRKQYETYQEQYMASYYKTDTKSKIDIRIKQPDLGSGMEHTIGASVKMYADGYVIAAIASGGGEQSAINVHIRAKKGEPIDFSKVQNASFGDGTCYIYMPKQYSELYNIHNLYPSYIEAEQASKLRKISFEANNNNQKDIPLTTISLPSNVEEVIFKNCNFKNSKPIALDLSSLKRLNVLNTTGSNFTAYIIASGAPLKEMIIEKPTSINLQNLYYLSSSSFKINNYENLTKIVLNGIDFNVNSTQSKNISKMILENTLLKSSAQKIIPEFYSLKNIGWDLNYENDAGKVTDNSIYLLDQLISRTPNEGDTRATSLIGFCNIDGDLYNNSNSINLYEKYNLMTDDDSTFPNFTLNFNGSESKLYTVNIKNGDGKIVWSRKISSLSDLNNSLLERSQQGSFNADLAIIKSESNLYNYIFNNSWKYTTSDGETGSIASDFSNNYHYLDLGKINGLNNFKSDITIEPEYIETTRYYTVSFYGQNQDVPFYVEPNAVYGQTFSQIKPDTIPVKDDSDLNMDQTYQFKGYSIIPGSNVLIDEDTWRVDSMDTNIKLYAVFASVSIYNIDYSEFLQIEGTKLKGLKLNSSNIPYYQGKKLVIPKNITEIYQSAFNKNTTLYYIFTGLDSRLDTIGRDAFNGSKIQYFEFPASLKTINAYAFKSCPLNIQNYTEHKIVFSNSLETIGDSAFNGIGSLSNKNIKLDIYVPNSIKKLGQLCFAHFNNTLADIHFGDDNNPISDDDLFTVPKTISSNRDVNNANSKRDIDLVEIFTNNINYLNGLNKNGVLLHNLANSDNSIFAVLKVEIIEVN